MHLQFTSAERAALRLAASIVDVDDVESFVRAAIMRAVHEIFEMGDDDVPIAASDSPIRGRDILPFACDGQQC